MEGDSKWRSGDWAPQSGDLETGAPQSGDLETGAPKVGIWRLGPPKWGSGDWGPQSGDLETGAPKVGIRVGTHSDGGIGRD